MSFLIENSNTQFSQLTDNSQDNLLKFQYIQNIILNSLNLVQKQKNGVIHIDNCQVININSQYQVSPISSAFSNTQIHPNHNSSSFLQFQILFFIYHKKFNQKYPICADISMNNIIMNKFEKKYVFKQKDLQKHKKRDQKSDQQKNIILNLSMMLRINNYSFLSSQNKNSIFSVRQIVQVYELIKNFNRISFLSTTKNNQNFQQKLQNDGQYNKKSNRQFNNIKLFLNQTKNLCLSSQKMIVAMGSSVESGLQLNQQQNRQVGVVKRRQPLLFQELRLGLVEYWKHLFNIIIQISQIESIKNNDSLNQKKQSQQLQESLQSNVQERQLKQTSQQNQQYVDKSHHQQKLSHIDSSKNDNSRKLSSILLKQLLQIKKSFTKAKQIKYSITKSTDNLEMLQKSISLLLPSFKTLKQFYRNFLVQSNQKQIFHPSSQSSQEEQLYSKVIQSAKTAMKQKNDILKKSIKNKLVHGLILISQGQKHRKQLDKIKEQNNFNQKMQSQKSKSNSSSSSEHLIEGCGQSVIKKVKHRAFIIDTIFKLRRLFNETQPQFNQQFMFQCQRNQSSQNKKQFIFSQKIQKSLANTIQICQFFAQKCSLEESKSSIESFINEYTFLKNHSDEYCQNVAKFYLDIEQEEKKTELHKRTIYSKWENGDFYQLVYRKLIQGQSQYSLSISTLLNYCSQMAESLCFMGKVNFVHRDIKMSNFLVTKGHTLKLTDFGSCYPNFYYLSENLAINSQLQLGNYSKKMRTTYGLTYNSQQINNQIRQKYTKQQFNSHATFDIYTFGVILKQVLYKTYSRTVQQNQLSTQINSVIQWLYECCMEKDPCYRLLTEECFVILKMIQKIKKHHKQQIKTSIKQMLDK